MEISELEVLPAALGAGTWRVFARRHLLPYRHPAVRAVADFLASLNSAFGPPPPEDPQGYVFWHRPTGTHFTAYVHQAWAAYGGGLRFAERPDARSVRHAYAAENAQRASSATPGADPLLADLAVGVPSLSEHSREVHEARQASPAGFFELLVEFEALLARHPPPDRCVVVAHGLDNPSGGVVSVTAQGVEGGRYFERQASPEEAHRAIAAKLEGDPERVAIALFDWWAAHTRLPKLPESLSRMLLDPWRTRFDAALGEPAPGSDGSYDVDARARHEDFERAQRWMRFARVGLLLPLAPADVDRLIARANGMARQSSEHKKLEKLRQRARVRT